jgi:hypothetical protein
MDVTVVDMTMGTKKEVFRERLGQYRNASKGEKKGNP